MPLRRLGAALVLVATALTVGALTLRDHRPQTRPVAAVAVATPSGIDVHFAGMMIVHHAQAVQMSRALVAKPGIPERVRLIAEFIVRDQQREIDETNAWLTAWGERPVEATGPDDAGEHAGADAVAHGMLTAAQLGELDRAEGAKAVDLFLRLMIEHHRGAIAMSRSLLDGGGRNVYIHGMAKHVIREQTTENDAMRALLPTR
ncbi:DUF305 domain-containing protein [Amorphoplanes digitatis]|uniref:Uncharacterized protein (DUF305 family) n=1 Tax=Actinoplanes digitatis TaxID=1868 RepID=A0A7W7I3Q8_9ACTN|nr:DUF305 domain-containing protein [Actinoplanes digitatis]MBB4765827.1 uncharacterized protein (DUF305 family) [Actinoplanes digitatis]BFE75750.1 hypothetical protein GCM10020092_090510 [Actinoplanes digitatis]GID93381.1 hypothetical protein Adi01nite_27930 [Actinoplanes digitatis]